MRPLNGLPSNTLDLASLITIANLLIYYRSRYNTFVAHIDPQKLRMEAATMTEEVVPVLWTMAPMHEDKKNWAKNTIELTYNGVIIGVMAE